MANWKFPTMKDKDKNKANKNKVSKKDKHKANVKFGFEYVACDCGREVPTDMMTDLSVLPNSKNLPEFVCDGCFTHILREKILTLAELADAHNAPAPAKAKFKKMHQRWYNGVVRSNGRKNSVKKDKTKPNNQ